MLEMSEAPFQKTPIQSIDLYASPKAQYERIAYSLATRLFPELYQSLRAENGSAKEIALRMQEVIGCEIFSQKSRKGKSQGFSGERFYEINEYWESGLSWRELIRTVLIMPQIVRNLSARARKVEKLTSCFASEFVRKSVRPIAHPFDSVITRGGASGFSVLFR